MVEQAEKSSMTLGELVGQMDVKTLDKHQIYEFIALNEFYNMVNSGKTKEAYLGLHKANWKDMIDQALEAANQHPESADKFLAFYKEGNKDLVGLFAIAPGIEAAASKGDYKTLLDMAMTFYGLKETGKETIPLTSEVSPPVEIKEEAPQKREPIVTAGAQKPTDKYESIKKESAVPPIKNEEVTAVEKPKEYVFRDDSLRIPVKTPEEIQKYREEKGF